MLATGRLTVILILGCSLWKCLAAQKGETRGCFNDNEAMRDLPYKPNDAGAHLTAERCIDECSRQYFMFAGLQAGKYCFCGSEYGKYGVGNCTIFCDGNKSQLCGGINANSIYVTSVSVPGPPDNLTLTTAKEHSLVVRWVPPRAPNGIILNYKVDATIKKSSLDGREPVMNAPPTMWMFNNSTYEAELPGLSPGSLYNISVAAKSALGNGVPLSALFWTDIAEPERPPMAEIIRQEDNRMTIEIPQMMSSTGPISAYRVVVYDESQNFPLDPNRLRDYEEAKKNKWPFYIAAELLPAQAQSPFVVGDGGSYGGYFNAPLGEHKENTVVIGVVSRLNGVTKASYSSPAKFHVKFEMEDNTATRPSSFNSEGNNGDGFRRNDGGNSMIFENHGGPSDSFHDLHEMDGGEHAVYDDSALVTGLGVAVGIGSALLVLSIMVYFLLRRHYGRRQQPDHQELTLQSPSPEITENGISSSIQVLEDEGDLDILYDSLKDRFWQIPRPVLEITEEVFGQGKFGVIYKGVTHRRNHEIPVAVQITQAHITDNEREKRAFLNDLDALIRIGSHTNVVGLIGGCEERVLFHICTEWNPETLKDFLLNSRTVDHYPVYAERQNRMSTLKEIQLLEIALGVARGMAHLAHNKILHKRLSCRSIVIVDEVTAKVSDFGLLQTEYTPPYDITRWLSMETLKSRIFASKSDVWMFGIVLWEIVTLGATPYSSVKSKEVVGRILRGSRLDQPKNVGDDLYQIMLQCWQVDLDERPTFQMITSILGTMITEGSDVERLHLDMYPGFQYEKYDRELEIVSALQ